MVVGGRGGGGRGEGGEIGSIYVGGLAGWRAGMHSLRVRVGLRYDYVCKVGLYSSVCYVP